VIACPELAKARELSSQHRTAFRRFGKLGLDLSQNCPYLSLVNLPEIPPDRFFELNFGVNSVGFWKAWKSNGRDTRQEDRMFKY